MNLRARVYTLTPGLNWDRVEFIFLDMNGTFMFGHDRFGDDVDYHETYRRLGGAELSSADLRQSIDSIVGTMSELYHSSDLIHCFPSVATIIADMKAISLLPKSEQAVIAQTIAYQECGQIDDDHLHVLDNLQRKFPLGVLSNLWSDKAVTINYFSRLGILNWFRVKLFSSDGAFIKPSRSFYSRAHLLSGCAPKNIVMIGDDEARDIVPAKAYGFQTIRIGDDPQSVADVCLPNLPAILKPGRT